ncbi:Flp pilus assembly protein CpaB [Pseudovibrio sp. SPO723]|uniref:Flp pilus assembly protein CpaB n=1 Tax=Nesiotobacter zosterae TaxID=392721 RepID=UPI0029C16182|nr:Flp pilus assembly protein CpaB [Pseudovibrio sp. SPO723]MDX5592371.1 Flp pilus assembly protein CpaB [Pseudovibrio sp. SPO723]
MNMARVVVLGIALGAGLIASMLVLSMTSSEPPAPVVVEAEPIETGEILVATADLQLGQRIASENIEWVKWPEEAIADGAIRREARPEAASELVGQITRSAIFAGEPIRSERIIDTDSGFLSAILPKGKRAVAVSVDAVNTAGGFILPGDKVDLILTRSTEGADGYLSETILENIRVLAIDTTTEGERDDKAMTPDNTATLELSPYQAEIVTRAQQAGTLSLALRSARDVYGEGEEPPQKRGAINFVKFGVSSQSSSGQ